MKLWIVRIGIAMMLVFVGWFACQHSATVVHAQEQPMVPKSFGHCVGSSAHSGTDWLIFESSDGTVRLVNMAGGKAITIERQ